MTKIKAKCEECKSRLWTDSERGIYCPKGHQIQTPLISHTPKTGTGPKWRMRVQKRIESTPTFRRRH